MQLIKVSATEALSLGETFAKSGMFPDIKTAQQAVVKIMAGQEIGIPPFAAMSGIHIIGGKPTIGAGLIASAVKGSGKYDFRVVEQSEKVCSIDFYQGKEKIGNSTFTIEEAKKAGTKNLDKFPKNMLFARAISNGVKWFTPDVFSGPVYVPEEMESVVTEEAQAVVIDTAEAITAARAATTIDELQSVWASNTALHGNAEFIKAVQEVKASLTPKL
jgi:hypothetical protein